LNAGIEVNRGSSTNTKLIWSEANTSWEFTNNGTTYDKIAGQAFANAAFATANTNATNITIIQGIDATQNTNITTASATAQAAFDKANSANGFAQSAFDKANTSVSQVSTTSTSPPASANNVGDIWYNTADDVIYRYTYDGTSYYWIDISGGTIVANTAASSIMTLNKTIGISMVFGG
jgi:hypothetical protein